MPSNPNPNTNANPNPNPNRPNPNPNPKPKWQEEEMGKDEMETYHLNSVTHYTEIILNINTNENLVDK